MIAERLRKAVLQAAISGQLTEQRPEDGTGAALAEEIIGKRNDLVQSGQLKKQKTLFKISDSDISFDIPPSWQWVKLGNIADCGSGSTPQGVAYSSDEDGTPFYRVSAMNLPGNETRLTTSDTYIENYMGKLTPYPSIVFPKNGGAVFTNKRRLLLDKGLVDLNTGYVRPLGLNLDYLYYWFTTIDLARVSTGSALPTVNATIISNLALPLPPLAEQERIVRRLSEILPLIDHLAELERERASRCRVRPSTRTRHPPSRHLRPAFDPTPRRWKCARAHRKDYRRARSAHQRWGNQKTERLTADPFKR